MFSEGASAPLNNKSAGLSERQWKSPLAHAEITSSVNPHKPFDRISFQNAREEQSKARRRSTV